jgi:predicted nucleic acid-binding protein
MRKQRVYLETTMFNYYYDKMKDAHPATVAFFEAIGRGDFDGYTSAITYRELTAALEPKRSKMLELIGKYHITMLEESAESITLADIYIKNGVIPAKKRLDARHIAIATVNAIDIILSYNFKHINKLKTKTMIPAINQIAGYRNITIAQSEEVIDL